ncbi:phage tail protein [Cryobacterium fucosi]|uniref:Phage tail tape measure protein n=1 Tax=Cryobacterium fucosi TaxID=1259157 RepID=A0A4R9B524_9MICO|nr:hypothetical protein [Cryobacterium fucosi]TFD74737.1 hypothetical protein E3T48_12490 [Cryobacterium fucosi]
MATKSLTFDLFGRDRTASSTINNLGDNADRMGGRFKKVGVAIGVGLAAIAVGLVKFGTDSVKAYADAEEQQAKLAFAFKKFPALADTNQKALQKLNGELQKKTRFDDDATAAAQASLGAYKLTGAQITQLTPLLQDYATKTGKDLPTAADDLGKAMLGQGRALKAVGINFTDTGSLAGNFDAVISGLTDKVGGLAEQSGRTAAGKLDILKNRFGEVQEKVGGALMPVLSGMMDFFDTTLMPGLEGAASWIASDGVPALSKFWDWLVKWKDILIPVAVGIGTLTGAMWFFNAAAAANPVGLIVLGLEAIIGIAAGVTIFFDQILGFFKDTPWAALILPLIGGVASVTLLVNTLVNFAPQIGAFVEGVVRWFTDLPAAIGQGLSDMVAAVGAWFGQLPGKAGFAVGTMVGTVLAYFMALPGQLANAGMLTINAVMAWFNSLPGLVGSASSNAVGTATSWFSGLPGKIMGIFSGAPGWLFQAGKNIIGGLVDGMSAVLGNIWSTMAKVAAAVQAGFNKAMGIKSPSTVMRDKSGRHVVGGIIQGVEQRIPDLVRTMANLADQMTLPSLGGSPFDSPTFAGRRAGGPVQVSLAGATFTAEIDGRPFTMMIKEQIKDASGWQGLEFDSGVGR